MADHDSLPAVLSGAKLTQSGLIAELGTLQCTVTVGLTAADRRREDGTAKVRQIQRLHFTGAHPVLTV